MNAPTPPFKATCVDPGELLDYNGKVVPLAQELRLCQSYEIIDVEPSDCLPDTYIYHYMVDARLYKRYSNRFVYELCDRYEYIAKHKEATEKARYSDLPF